MQLIDMLPQSDVVQIAPLMKPIDEDEPASNSISPINIPLRASQGILAVSPTGILVDECRRKRQRLIRIDCNLQKFSIRSPIRESIQDAIWYQFKQKYLLMTIEQIFSYDPKSEVIDCIWDVEKPLQSWTIDESQSSLFIAYDKWGLEYIDQLKEEENGKWKQIGRVRLNLTSNEFIGNILAINEEIAMTIYNNLTEEWRMEIRHTEMSICLKTILLPGKDKRHDYRILKMKNNEGGIQWLIYSQFDNQNLAFDMEWQQRDFIYRTSIFQMAVFGEQNLIIRTRNSIDIHSFT